MELLETRDGLNSACINGQLIHSKFSPLKEAEKFFKLWIEKNPLNPTSSLIVIEPGLGYLLSLLENQEISEIIVFFLSNETYTYCYRKGLLENLKCWFPGRPDTAVQFLEKNLGGYKIQNIRILEWSPGIRIFPELYKEIQTSLLQYMKILQANEITTVKFGKKWLKNSLLNYIQQNYNLFIGTINRNVILAASGFSLNWHMEELTKFRNNLFIAALPSSVEALVANGIIPDLIISTDPGYYASEHYRRFPEKVPVAAPLSAYPKVLSNPLIGINQLSELDKLLWQQGEFSFTVPEMGTVAATALGILQQLSSSEIYILGLDLCMKDLQEHVSPHPFEIYSVKDSCRFKTGTQYRYERIKALAASRKDGYYYSNSMITYRNWFGKNTYNSRIVRVSPSPVSLPMKEISSLEGFANVKQITEEFKLIPSEGTREARKERCLKLLNHWISHPDNYNSLTKSLFNNPEDLQWQSDLNQLVKTLELL